MEHPGVPDLKSCPECGKALLPYGVPRSLSAARFLATNLLLWGTGALFLAFLWSPRGDGELYAVLGAAALVAWALMRSRQSTDRQEFAARGRYHCDQCDLHFEGDDLRRLPPP